MPWGSQINTQRMSAGGLPERYQTARCEVSSTVRLVPPYQATVALVLLTEDWSSSVFGTGPAGLSTADGRSDSVDGAALAHRGRRPRANGQ